MNEKRIVLFVLIFLVAAVAVSSQEQGAEQPSMYAINVPVQRVYPHRLGYKVVYNRTDLYPQELFLPGRWFTEAAGRAEIMESLHPSVPYMTVIYRDGEVSHIRLFVHRHRTHRSWGAIPSDRDLREQFASDDLNIRY